jgi:UDP-N-acetylmuramoylalanine--D-glutamate ligase
VKLLLRRGVGVFVSCKAESEASRALRQMGAEILVGDPVDAARRFVGSKPVDPVAVFSPGIPMTEPEAVFCRRAGIAILGELELGAEWLRSRLIAVTGSKGKSSCVKLIADTLCMGGVTAVPCGNYGTALCEVADGANPPAVAVVECSSFQLETIGNVFKPSTAIILNLSRDHLDRHLTMEAYRDTKLGLFRNMREEDLALLPAASGDAYGLLAGFRRLYGRDAVTFGNGADAQWRYTRGSVANEGNGFRANVAGSYFDHDVLGPAAAASCAVLWAEGLSVGAVEAGFREFKPLAHRMQLVREVGGVRFVDDSKATSIAALLAGASMSRPPVYLIAGGRLKERITATGKEVVTSGVKKAYLIGECMEEMDSAWSAEIPTERCGSLSEAVSAAFRDAPCGGTVLLSPGTASFDQFKDYKQRGEVFTRLVHDLQDKCGESRGKIRS